MTRFGPALARLRRDAGFSTPYAFYHRSGGRRMFPFTFQYYLKIEAGKSVPRPDWVPVLVSALRVAPSHAVYRDLVCDYLRDLCGKEETFAALISPLMASATPEGQGPALIRRLLYSRAYPLSLKQFEALAASEAAYWAFEYLSNTDEAMDAAELSRRTGLPAKALAQAMAKLTALKLLRKASGGRWRCHLVGRRLVYPSESAATTRARKAVRGYIEAMAERTAGPQTRSGFIFRSTEGNILAAAGDVRARLEQAAAASVYDALDGTALYYLDFRARRVLVK